MGKLYRFILSLLISVMGLVVFHVAHAAIDSPVGVWTTIDEETGEKRADVRFQHVNGELIGTIEHRYTKPGDITHCTSCPQPYKNQPLQGLRFIWGLKETENGDWVGGHILNPQTGHIYHFKMTLRGDKLHVRGYVGHPLFGRTQIWIPAT